jgi:tellurite resistance protein TehA-like permease
MAAFGVGAFFWLVIGTVVTVRLMTGAEVPPAAKTGLTAYLAAPATANIAWMLSHPGPVGAVQLGLTGVLVIMALKQVMLLPEYRKLPFTPMFWVFTFPVGATTNYPIRSQQICAGLETFGPSARFKARGFRKQELHALLCSVVRRVSLTLGRWLLGPCERQ